MHQRADIGQNIVAIIERELVFPPFHGRARNSFGDDGEKLIIRLT